MKRSDPLLRYTLAERKWAFIDAMNNGFSVRDTIGNPFCIQWMLTRLEIYREAQRHGEHREERPARADVPPPNRIPSTPHEASPDFLCALEDVGTVRGVYLVADGGGGYTATVKITDKNNRRVYRYGRLRQASGLAQMVLETIKDARWSPDKM